ncbi:MAG: pentapeptide repeat-containing protein [Proteobacteria bacterium]|nr:pentapeptide repeat-containing protein [Pseudomonadota bacterium]
MNPSDQKHRCAWPTDEVRKEHAGILKDYEGCPHGEEGELYRSKKDGKDYCLFHLPLEDKPDQPDLAEEFRKLFGELIKEGQADRTDAERDFRGFRFPDAFQLKRHDFRPEYERAGRELQDEEKVKPINFDLAVFGNNVSWDSCHFGDSAGFLEARFGDWADFFRAQFGDWADFFRAQFGDSAGFRQARFGDRAGFRQARFGDSADFNWARFGDSADFNWAQFNDSADFFRAQFNDSARFTRAQFNDSARFTRAHFGDSARFTRAHFGDQTSFDQALFQGRVEFIRLSGREHTRLEAARFEGQHILPGATDKIKSDGKIFGRLAGPAPPDLSFERAQFLGPALFHHDDLSRTRFHQVNLDHVSFLHSRIAQTRFVSCDWGREPENEWLPEFRPSLGNLFRRIFAWYPCRWLDYLFYPDQWRDILKWLSPLTLPFRFRRPRLMFDEKLWRARQTDGSIEIEHEISWERLTDKEQDEVTVEYDCDPPLFVPRTKEYRVQDFGLDPESFLPSDIEVLALQMKESLERTKDPIPAGDFHFAAMEMKRHQAVEKRRRPLAIGLWVYKMLSGYGERPGRTLLWFSLTVLLAAGLYLTVNGSFGQALFWSIQHSLPFKFAATVALDFNSLFSAAAPPVPEFLHWLGLAETFVGTALFTFFVLALRRRFKR